MRVDLAAVVGLVVEQLHHADRLGHRHLTPNSAREPAEIAREIAVVRRPGPSRDARIERGRSAISAGQS